MWLTSLLYWSWKVTLNSRDLFKINLIFNFLKLFNYVYVHPVIEIRAQSLLIIWGNSCEGGKQPFPKHFYSEH